METTIDWQFLRNIQGGKIRDKKKHDLACPRDILISETTFEISFYRDLRYDNVSIKNKVLFHC